MSDFMCNLGIHNLTLFILAGWALNLTPGPDVFYMVTHALKGGWRAGTVAAAGIFAGCLVHVLAATVGLSALVASSATAFTVLKMVGAMYLVYVGFKMITSKPSIAINNIANEAINTPAIAKNTSNLNKKELKKVFLQGFWTNVLNPKVALFFLAFLPQFIAPNSAHPSLAFLTLGIVFNVSAIPINMGYVLLATWLKQRANVVQRSMHWLERVAGAVFMGFGVKLALTELPH
jgi:threonine/homoserine/homoserine lactone efflux protein